MSFFSQCLCWFVLKIFLSSSIYALGVLSLNKIIHNKHLFLEEKKENECWESDNSRLKRMLLIWIIHNIKENRIAQGHQFIEKS